MKRSRKRDAVGECADISFDTVRKIVRDLAGAVEGTSYGTPAFHVGKTLFVRQHQDGESLVVRIEPEERALRVSADPTVYYVTDHYVNYPWVLVRMANIEPDDLRELLEEAWRLGAATRRGKQRAVRD